MQIDMLVYTIWSACVNYAFDSVYHACVNFAFDSVYHKLGTTFLLGQLLYKLLYLYKLNQHLVGAWHS